MSGLSELQARLGYTFREEQLLERALTHSSITQEQHTPGGDNQRLEFLGDAVLQLVLTHELHDKFSTADEGLLTKARAQMVNRHTLARQGNNLELGAHLRLSRGEETTGGRQRPAAQADAFEAVVGAIYLDGGFEAARTVVLRLFREVFGELRIIPNLHNPKGELQELLQAESNEAPIYLLQSIAGPDHDRRFECSVLHRGIELGRGTGRSKKEAESQAAVAALQSLARSPRLDISSSHDSGAGEARS
jgi:ribonuclease III